MRKVVVLNIPDETKYGKMMLVILTQKVLGGREKKIKTMDGNTELCPGFYVL